MWKSYESDKFKKIYWETDIGKGRPGWHIECSAIARHYLPNVTFHLGGEDLKFPHHTNEIAQCEVIEPFEPFGKYWLHVSHLCISNPTATNDKEDKKEEKKQDEKKDNKQKMSKSIGNVIYLEELLQKYHPFVVRIYLASKHYRRKCDFSESELSLCIEQVCDIHYHY